MVLPGFDLQGGFPICAARGMAVGALLSSFGSLTFRCLVAPKAFARMAAADMADVKRRLLWVTRASSLVAVIAYGAWLLLQAGNMADADGVAGALGAILPVLTKTTFGRVIGCQLCLLALLVVLVGAQDQAWRRRAASLTVMLAVVLQAGHSHAYAMYDGPSLLLACDVLHLLGAGAWLGGLVPLVLLVGAAPAKVGAIAARWFSPLGKGCIAALSLSAGVQGWVLVATIPGLVGTAYGWMVLAKLCVFAVLLGFAAANRYRFAPALRQGQPEAAKRMLVRSILVQTGFAAIMIAAAVVLSELPPAMHEQPVWPFAYRFSLAAIQEDPDFGREVLQAGLALAGAVGLMLVSLLLRRFRLAAVAVAAIIAWVEIPHLDLLLVPAYPTSFYHSPSGFASSSIMDGQAIYARHCVTCHGAGGHGDGPAAKTLPVPPADLTADHLWMHQDGELFWWLTHGMRTPEGTQAMPGFAPALDEDQRWAVIDFIRARNAGDRRAATGAWAMTLQAPGFGARCGRKDLGLQDFSGKFVLVRFGASATVASLGDVVTILAAAPPGPVATSAACSTNDETVAAAYAIVAGLDTAQLQEMDFLIDDHGLLRALRREDATSNWDDPVALEAEIQSLRMHPLTRAAPAPMNMPM